MCSIADCAKPIWNVQLCQMHYWRRRRRGTTDAPQPPTAEERFWAKVTKARGCWTWNTVRANGYGGSFWDGSAFVPPHRYSYELHKGPIPDGLQVDHLCFNRICVNPTHLEAVTSQENTIRATRRAGLSDRCNRGHVYTAETTYVAPNGYRQCRTCYDLRRARARRARS